MERLLTLAVTVGLGRGGGDPRPGAGIVSQKRADEVFLLLNTSLPTGAPEHARRPPSRTVCESVAASALTIR